jgi:hypothetical protein
MESDNQDIIDLDETVTSRQQDETEPVVSDF